MILFLLKLGYVMNSEIKLVDFNIYRIDRNKDNSLYIIDGGVIIAVRNIYESYIINTSCDIEHICKDIWI